MKNHKLILSVLYGFFLIAACQFIIEIILDLYMHYGLNNDFREIHFKYYMLAIGAIIAILLSIVVARFFILKTRSQSGLPEFSKFWLVVFIAIVAIFPVYSHYSNRRFMNMYNDSEMTRYLSNRDINAIFSAADLSILVSKWVLIAALLLVAGFFYMKKK